MLTILSALIPGSLSRVLNVLTCQGSFKILIFLFFVSYLNSLVSYPEPESTCAFGTSGFDLSKSKTFVRYPNKNLNITYGSGEVLNGIVGFDTVTIGGMTVKKQEISLVTHAAWNGDGVSTGLMGLAYPALTRVYNGTNPTKDVRNHTSVYSPLFFTAVSEKVVSHPCGFCFYLNFLLPLKRN